VEAQSSVGIIVDEHEQRFGVVRRQPGFLSQLAERRGDRLLAVGDLAAGELPSTRKVLLFRALRDEHPAIAHHDREGDLEPRFRLGDQAGAPAAPGL
jgi:hypothetical protein